MIHVLREPANSEVLTWRRTSRSRPRRPLRVVIAFDWFLKYVARQAIALRSARVDVALLCRTHAHEFDGRSEERRRLLELVEEAGVGVLEVPGRFRSTSALPALLD